MPWTNGSRQSRSRAARECAIRAEKTCSPRMQVRPGNPQIMGCSFDAAQRELTSMTHLWICEGNDRPRFVTAKVECGQRSVVTFARAAGEKLSAKSEICSGERRF